MERESAKGNAAWPCAKHCKQRARKHEITVDDPATFNFMTGDVMVMQPHKGGKQAGHVAGYDGQQWVSDFAQRDFWAGPDYRKEKPKYVVYRY